MNVVYVKIHSDLRKEGQIYQVSDEVEQEVEIFADGKVCLHAISHEGLPCWEEEKEVEPDVALEMLANIATYLENPRTFQVDHVGQWQLNAKYEDGSTKEVKGPMIGKVMADNVDLTAYLREKLPFMSLGIFDQTDSL